MKQFKVLVPWQSKLTNYPNSIPWDMLNEKRAQSNHSQTLQRLNERGGMCVSEILHNLNDEKLKFGGVETQEMVDDLNNRIAKFNL